MSVKTRKLCIRFPATPQKPVEPEADKCDCDKCEVNKMSSSKARDLPVTYTEQDIRDAIRFGYKRGLSYNTARMQHLVDGLDYYDRHENLFVDGFERERK